MKQAKATYAFTARSEVEISFEVGDVIVILEETPSGWGKGRTKEYKEGYFPLAYVQVEDLSDSDSDEDTHKQQQLWCTTLYDFAALSGSQLSFSKGDVIKVTKKGNDNDWWEGILERTKQRGLFPSNYVKVDHGASQIIQTLDREKQQTNNFTEPAQSATHKKAGEAQYTLNEQVESKQHKKDEITSNFRVEEPYVTEIEPLISSIASPSNPNQYPTGQKNTAEFTNTLSPLDVSAPLHTVNYREFATLSPISPNLSLAYDSTEMARRRHSMNISSASPLALSTLSGEYTRDFDALCLLYPFVPSSVPQNAFTPTKQLASSNQPAFISPPSTPATEIVSQLTQPISFPSHQIPQSRPQSAPQFFTPFTARQSTRQSTPPHSPSAQASTQLSPSTPPKPAIPKLTLTSSPDRRDGYSNRERNHASSGATTQATAQASTNTSMQSSASGGTGAKTPGRTPSGKYGSSKRDSSTSAGTGAGSSSKRKVRLEASLSLGKRPNSTITHSNSAPEHPQDVNQATSTEAKPKDENEVEYLKKVLQQEIELRTHLESVVHDAHGKMNSASQYIKDLKAELFQAQMDISQLRVTNRQLNEQLDKYQLVTRMTVATQTERDENIDKIRLLTEQIHELEMNTDLLNEQIASLKNKCVDRSPRTTDRSPREMSGNGEEVANRSVARVDYAAVKQQFARVRECLLLEKDLKDRLFIEKTQAQEKLLKTEQHNKQIKRKLLTELQLKSDLNVRNQQIEFQMQKLKEELAIYKH